MSACDALSRVLISDLLTAIALALVLFLCADIRSPDSYSYSSSPIPVC